MIPHLRACLIPLILCPSPLIAQSSPTAEFELRFDATWSNATHPGAFPAGAHFSPLIGATHNANHHFWSDGGLATNGIESMAETGSTSGLTVEINAAIQQGNAYERLTGPGIGSPDSATRTFTASETHPLFTMVTMIAPSPDWFVGVDGYELIQDGRWIDTVTIELYAWDAGTDSGANFNSPNQDTNPADPIALQTGGPFFGITPLGTFTLTRLSGASYCDAMINSQSCLPSIDSTGSASVSGASSFTIEATNVLNNQAGLLLYGFAERDIPFQGGTLCLGPPHRRTPVQSSGGNPPPLDCSGTYAFDMGAWIQSGIDPSLPVGTRVYAQFWSRDPQAAFPSGLTNGIEFAIFP